MFGKRLTLFRLFGFEIRADASWLIIFALVTWSLAAGAFPHYYRNLSTGTYWAMGAIGALGLFVCILLHEISHSLVARRFGQEVKGITLWIFGGVAETATESETPREELLMAAAGPAASLVIGGAFFGIQVVGVAMAWPLAIQGVVAYLAFVNVVLAIFNLVPAFPLDGGRILRAALWRRRGIVGATRIASAVGNGFGWLLIGLGGASVLFGGSLIGGLWWILIGSFVRQAAKGSYRQLVASRVLEGAPVRRVMNPWAPTVPPGTSVDRFVSDWVYRHGGGDYPLTRGDEVVGSVDANDVRKVPNKEWAWHTVDELARAVDPDEFIAPDADAAEALRRLQTTGSDRLLVGDARHLEGVLTVEGLRRYLQMQAELGEDGRARRRDGQSESRAARAGAEAQEAAEAQERHAGGP